MAKNTTPTPGKVQRTEADIIHIRMLERGWSEQSMADRCGMGMYSLRNQFYLGFPSRPTRYRIEAALGELIWMWRREWRNRLALARILGFDPYVEEKKRLQARATVLGVPYSSNRRILNKTELIMKLERYLLK